MSRALTTERISAALSNVVPMMPVTAARRAAIVVIDAPRR